MTNSVSPEVGTRRGQPICWHADSFDPRMASVRLRVLQPMHFLRERGYDVRKHGGEISDCAIIIFSKSCSAEAVALAEWADREGRHIVYDICDNVFEKPSRDEQDELRKDRVRRLMSLATIVTCATLPLASLVAQEVPVITAKTVIVPDALEDMEHHSASPSFLERLRLWRLQRFLRQNAGALHLVWFGKCKKGYAGIEHVGSVVELLDRLPLARPVTLTVISNRKKIYRRCASGWRIPKFYLPWSLGTFKAALRLHDVAIIPVDQNSYTLGKTINRPATALMAGLGVIADSIPAYEELRPFMYIGDWERGLSDYSRFDPKEDDRVTAAQSYLLRYYGPDVVTDRWAELVDRLLPDNPTSLPV